MIYKLRNNFIRISALALVAVLVCIYLATYFINANQLDSNMDALADLIVFEKGRPPVFRDVFQEAPSEAGYFRPDRSNFITRESSYSTRYFTVEFNTSGQVTSINTDKIASVTREEAENTAKSLYESYTDRGWIGEYRYKIIREPLATRMVFLDGSSNRELYRSYLLTSALVLLGSGLVAFLLIILFSTRAVTPVAESYEKQKQFVTNVNHELKTPLTLILANLDIAESELGKNEWLDDIRYEGKQMASLVEQLVSLSRMDEESTQLSFEDFNVSEMLLDITSEFKPAALASGRTFSTDIDPNVSIKGDEAVLRQIVSVLLDNALKYCDEGGEICCSLSKGKHLTLSVTNSFANVNSTDLNRLFDRFYRQDKARTSGSGFGIGLSIAKAMTEKHGGRIQAYKADENTIGFKVVI